MLLFVVSCTNDIDEVVMFETIPMSKSRSTATVEEEHPLIKGGYVDFVDNKYVITISEEGAILKGFSKESYQEFQHSVVEANKMLDDVINDCLSRGNKVFVESCLNDNCEKDNFISSIKTRSEGGTENFPRGTITTSGQEYGRATIDMIPYNMKYVDCDCYSYSAPCPTQVVVTDAFGSSNIKSSIGSQRARIKVMFPVSNVPGGIRYKTTDSNGGICGWVGTSN